MSTTAVKRRRIEAASSTLSKPFRSPFKVSQDDPGRKVEQASPLQGSMQGQTEGDISLDAIKESALPKISSPSTTPLYPKLRKNAFFSPSSTTILQADPDIAPLINSQRLLEKQLRALREDLDVAQQAGKIERDSRTKHPNGDIDSELIALRQKWTDASRAAAEELFTGVRDRVNRMGGPKAWKEMQERQREFMRGFDEVPQRRPGLDSDDDEAQDREKSGLYAEYDVDTETANEKEARGGNEVPEEQGDEEYTMSMMLRTLNIDLKVIGYDWEQQRWVD